MSANLFSDIDAALGNVCSICNNFTAPVSFVETASAGHSLPRAGPECRLGDLLSVGHSLTVTLPAWAEPSQRQLWVRSGSRRSGPRHPSGPKAGNPGRRRGVRDGHVFAAKPFENCCREARDTASRTENSSHFSVGLINPDASFNEPQSAALDC